MPAAPATSVAAPSLPAEVSSIEGAPVSSGRLAGFAEAAEATRNYDASAPKEAPAETAKSTPKVETKPPVQKQPEKNGQQQKPNGKPAEQQVQKNGNGQQPDWKSLKDKATKYDTEFPKVQQEREKFAKEVEEWRGKHQSLEKQYKEAEALVKWAQREQFANRLEESEPYQREVAKPWADAKEDCQRAADRYQIDPDALWDAISEPDKYERIDRLEEILKDNPNRDRVLRAIGDTMDSVQKAGNRYQEMQKQAEGLRNQMVAERENHQQQLTAKQQHELKQAREETRQVFQEQIPELFESKDPEVLKQLEEADKADFVDTPMDRALSARAVPYAIALTGILRQEREKFTRDLAERDATIAELSGARPGGLENPQSQDQDTKPLTAAEAWKEAIAKSGFGRR